MYPVSRTSERLTLRELHPHDTDHVLAIYSDPRATEHLSFTPRTRDQVTGIVERSITSATAEPRTEYALAVTTRHNDQLTGYARLALDPHQQQAATIGFALTPATWGNGYGTETVRLLLGLAFEDLGLHRVWGARSPHNEVSARTMARAGMTEEGRIREHIHKNGAWRDSIVHAILEREWTTNRNTQPGTT
ncbi:GNAT family N-acetyltransferase [Streptomyces yaizuensis]|uniref:GNAT family N-acetyltransferase n=1 Tax=Streptomyces yaizuensis TaxID=2989713 RepID=A0ABQ5NYH5_9ACTN|nr:GNAT family protein [Streptomyces sp. YSPA8]GLF95213.1 GNAT family N-acetyltransferase [Streptomyces sp. YSPA8]